MIYFQIIYYIYLYTQKNIECYHIHSSSHVSTMLRRTVSQVLIRASRSRLKGSVDKRELLTGGGGDKDTK
jgi:hypothetical protein